MLRVIETDNCSVDMMWGMGTHVLVMRHPTHLTATAIVGCKREKSNPTQKLLQTGPKI